jgi:hypothetical protein
MRLTGSRRHELIQVQRLIDGIEAVIYQVDRNGWIKLVIRRAVQLFAYSEERRLGVGDLRANSDNGKPCSQTTSSQALDARLRTYSSDERSGRCSCDI